MIECLFVHLNARRLKMGHLKNGHWNETRNVRRSETRKKNLSVWNIVCFTFEYFLLRVSLECHFLVSFLCPFYKDPIFIYRRSSVTIFNVLWNSQNKKHIIVLISKCFCGVQNTWILRVEWIMSISKHFILYCASNTQST